MIALSFKAEAKYIHNSTIINESFTSANATLWNNYGNFQFNSVYSNYPSNGMTTTLSNSCGVVRDINTLALEQDYQRAFQYVFETQFFIINNTMSLDFTDGLCGGELYLRTSSNAFYQDTITYTQTDFGFSMIPYKRYDLKYIGNLTHFNIYLNNTLYYSSSDSSKCDAIGKYTNFYFYFFDCGGSGAFIDDKNAFFDNMTLVKQQIETNTSFNIVDEITGGLYTNALNLYLYDKFGNLVETATTNNGTFKFINLYYTYGYTLKYSSPTNLLRSYEFNVSNLTNSFTVYTVSTSEATPYIFYIKDFTTDKFIQGANVVLYKNINGSQTQIYSGLTDLQGTVSVYMNNTGVYSIEISKNGYSDKSGSINVLISPQVFTFYLNPSQGQNPSENLTGVGNLASWKIYPSDTVLTNASYQKFWFYVNNQDGNLQNVSITTIVNGTTYYNQTLNSFTNNVSLDVVPNQYGIYFDVNYSYKLANKPTFTKTVTYYVQYYPPVVTTPIETPTLASLSSSFSIGNRLILVSVLAIIVVVLLSFVVPFGFAFIGGMFVYGWFLIIGWFGSATSPSSWIIGTVLVVGLVFLLSKGDSLG